MRQITESDLRFILGFEISRVGRGTLNNLGSGHQDTARRARDVVVARLMARMEKWEILVPEPSAIAVDHSPMPAWKQSSD